jgi:signal transduction histidine kinase
MRLADFIENRLEAILLEWDAFAGSLLPGGRLDAVARRDHAEEILRAVAADLRMEQTQDEKVTKRRGGTLLSAGAPETAAQTHANLRARAGFSIEELVAEYQALRSCVLRLWIDEQRPASSALNDVVRFNEAIDQAISESIQFFVAEQERWRQVFLAVLGHDLRAPLNAILLTAMVISGMNGTGLTSEHTSRLMRSGERMRELLNDLLDYSRTSLERGIPIQRRTCNLALVCREEIDLLRAALPGASIDLVVSGNTNGTWDPSRVRQIISNLVTNAVKYGEPSQPVLVELQGEDREIALKVSNAGSIAKESLHTIFSPVRPRHQGRDMTSLGLGLFIVRQIAISHGGEVTVDSAGGVTVFTVRLPKG